MQYSADDETVIVINEGDRREGFFRFSTTKSNDFKRLCKRVGGEDRLLSVKVETQGKSIVSWQCRVPVEFLGRAGWSIGKKREGRTGAFQRQEILGVDPDSADFDDVVDEEAVDPEDY